MREKLLVFGGGGFVGGNLCAIALRRGWEVHIADAEFREGVPGAEWHILDVTDHATVRRLAGDVGPSAVVNLAAVADVDRAERERDLAWAVNVEAARAVASSCAAAGAHCMHFSSDAVFAGDAPRYAEEDPTGPVNYYGVTKLEGERAVTAADPGAGVVRVSLVLGFPVTAGNSFFAALEKKLKAGSEVAAPRDEIRTPVDVLTLSECVLELVGLRFSGVIHLGSTDSVDRASLTRRAAELMGFPEARVKAQEPAAPVPGRAPRHKNGIIGVAKARRLLRTPLVSAEQSILRAIRERL